MKLRWRITLIIAAACALNLAMLLVYYNVVIVPGMESDYSDLQRELLEQAKSVAVRLEAGEDYETIRDAYDGEDFRIAILSEDGSMVWGTNWDGNREGYTINAMVPLNTGEEALFVDVSHSVPIVQQSDTTIRSLFWGEFVALPLILAIATVLIYWYYIRPIEELDKVVAEYGRGVQPVRVGQKDEIGHLHNTFVRMTEQISEEQMTQDRIIASISHDIKTPLTSVMGYTEQLRRSNLPPERQERYLNTIYEKSIVIRNLIDEFDEYLSSHLDGELHRGVITAEELCRILEMDYREELEMRGIRFQVDDHCPKALMMLDTAKVRRVFGNIIDNSVKHLNRENGGIRVRVEQQDTWVQIDLSDNGSGVKEENLGRIFDALYTSDESRSVAGLGLAICKQITEAHGGRISAQNRSGGGLTVLLRLPVHTEDT